MVMRSSGSDGLTAAATAPTHDASHRPENQVLPFVSPLEGVIGAGGLEWLETIMAIDLVPLCTVHVQLNPPTEVGLGPAGTRLIFEHQSANLQGDRLDAKLTGAATADWFTVGPEGTGTLDIRATYRTHDDAIIFVQYQGRVDLTQGTDPPKTIYVAPRFETGDERYVWLNRIQAAGKGIVHEDLSIDFEWYELR